MNAGERIDTVPGIIEGLERRATEGSAIKVNGIFMLLDADQQAEWADLRKRGVQGDV